MKIRNTLQYIFVSSYLFLLVAPSSALAASLQNPLKVKSFEEFVKELLNAVIYIGLPVVALFIIYSGFLFITAQGDVEKIKTAKNTFLYTIIGVAIFLGSLTLAKIIEGTIKLIT